ncbi:MAG: hypothetical protein L6Q54_13580 [Leptospiraceae bacterium]|nr:hypothetical protein [Leptospiraceae bacterium]MCK6382265.1 hypothetical protein [Leptospiraceae bacterium]
MKSRKIIMAFLLFFFIFSTFDLYSQKSNVKESIIGAILAEDLILLKEMFDKEVYISNGFETQFSNENGYDGFIQKKGDLYKVLFNSIFAKDYFGIEKVQSFREVMKMIPKKGKFFENQKEGSAELVFQNKNLIYSITLLCSKKGNCKITVFSISEWH